MIIKQLSVFLENRSGRLTEVTAALAEHQINITAQCVAETSDFGILRMVVSDPERARQILSDRGLSVSLTDVLCLTTPNVPGALHRALQILSDRGVSIDYMYAFAVGDKACVILRTPNVEATAELLVSEQQVLLTASDVYAF
ncbi:MAG TPA: ACT domain-containing protein [Polyangiaceae bacterium]